MTASSLVLAALLLGPADGALPTVDVRPSSTNVSIGEKFRVTLEVHGPRGLKYDFPRNISDGNIEMIQAPVQSASPDSAVYETQLFALGSDARIPPIQVSYTSADGSGGVVETAPITLNPVSALDPSEKEPVPADYAPPQPVLVARLFWVINGLAGLVLLAGLVALVRKLRLPRKVSDALITPPVSAEEEALSRLASLAGSAQLASPKPFYIELVQILKQYLERRLEAPVLEMTSTEALGVVRAHEWTTAHAAPIRDLINAADLAKFGGVSDASSAERHLQLVREVVANVDQQRRARDEELARLERQKQAT